MANWREKEELVFNLTISANELFAHGEYRESIRLFQMVDRLCDAYDIDMPDEGVSLNIALDDKFGIDATSISEGRILLIS